MDRSQRLIHLIVSLVRRDGPRKTIALGDHGDVPETAEEKAAEELLSVLGQSELRVSADGGQDGGVGGTAVPTL